ncbi:DUF2726 domain-containing protein [Eikenella corrodens]|jgi:hypothetical protein|uniref:DUF2726 domain-containing protein n=1 Tax=Eikenella corrodens TaxID=539 RepID=UPI0007D063C3|nr:DUF2726 domain-containing protein [Eikenella corrodens]OAM31921.1 hypothetical protein A7P93_03890 [Eikenella corrodens]
MMLILAVVVAVIIFALISGSKKSGGRRKSNKMQRTTSDDTNQPWPFYPTYAMTRNEQEVYWKLVQALPDYIVLAQVQASRILKVKRGENHRAWFNRISRMSYDYLICQKNSYPLLVIELDDATHEKADRQDADRRKKLALASAGIKIIRWRRPDVPSTEQIRSIVQQKHARIQERMKRTQ